MPTVEASADARPYLASLLCMRLPMVKPMPPPLKMPEVFSCLKWLSVWVLRPASMLKA